MKKIKHGQVIQTITWEEILVVVKTLSILIPTDAKLYPIPRGGVIPAALLCQLESNREILTLNKLYEEDSEVWLIDDINDSGNTLINLVADVFGNKYCQKGVLYERHSSQIKTDAFGAKLLANNWLKFPWEVDIDGVENLLGDFCDAEDN